jgi:hypothetical protein
VVDIEKYVPAGAGAGRPPTIGWIGSPSTWGFVRPLLPLLAELCRDGRVRFSAVGAGAAAEADRFDGGSFEAWSEAGEIAAVQSMDIGIMPLPDEPWARGKSGYKLVQYMACGVPVVASPVGVNCEIVHAGVNGFLAREVGEWRATLTRLLEDAGLRKAMGQAGRERAVEAYSLQAHAARLIEVMQKAVGPSTRKGPEMLLPTAPEKNDR